MMLFLNHYCRMYGAFDDEVHNDDDDEISFKG